MKLRLTPTFRALVGILCVAACGDSFDDGASAPGADSRNGMSSDAGASTSPGSSSSDSGSATTPSPADRTNTDRTAPPKPDAGDASACADLDSSKPATLYLSADDSNSMASPVIARSLIRKGEMVPADLLRTYEFLNYYNVAYAQPASGTLGLTVQARPSSDPAALELQIGVQSPPAISPRRAINMVLVLDTSGSMAGKPMDLERAAIRALASQLKAGDVVSAVSWNTAQLVLLDRHVATGPNDPSLLGLAQTITADGGTDLNSGLAKGYELADAAFDPTRINRVVVISDGIANVGVTNETLIGAKAEDQDKEAIYLVGVGVGDGVNDTLMDAVTDAGRGAYVYLDTEDEAERMLADRFDEVMDVAARAVQVELKLPWYFQMQTFYGEEYSADPKKVKPQHLAPGDAMVFQQIIRACDANVRVATDPVEVTARWVDPFTYAPKSVNVSKTLGGLETEAAGQLLRGRAIIAYAEALKTTAGATASQAAFDTALSLADASDPAKADAALNEIRELVTTYRTRVTAP